MSRVRVWSRAVGCRVVRDQLAPWERVRVTDDDHEQRQTVLFGGGTTSETLE